MRFFPLIILHVFSAFVPAQVVPASYTVHGTVHLPDGEPASRVLVKLSSQASISLQAITSDLGRFEIPGLPRGRYYLTVVNPAAPEQFSDPVEVDATRGLVSRILINVHLRSGVKIESRKENSAVTVTVMEAAQHVPKPARDAFLRAQKYGAKNRHAEALASFNQAIALYPAYFQALAARGHLRISIGQVAEAAQDFALALELNSRYEPALRGAGVCKFINRRFDEAIKDFERAILEFPGNASSHLFLGMSHYALDRRAPARAELQRALSLDPVGAARAHIHLANLWIQEKRPREAIAEIQAYLAAIPNARDAEKWRAVAAQLRQQSMAK